MYVDGANLNALVGLAQPGHFGADVSHLNLHKTFCIPHGGGGPGVGPVAVRAHLAPFLPGHPLGGAEPAGRPGVGGAVRLGRHPADPVGLHRADGPDGLRQGDRRGDLLGQLRRDPARTTTTRCCTPAPTGRVGHECIVDLRPITKATGVTVDDVAKRLMDYGFHAPTMSFPVAGTLMIEPTESETLAELDRFCDAMIAIRGEIDQVAAGEWPLEREPAAPRPAHRRGPARRVGPARTPASSAPTRCASLRVAKYFPPVSRIDAAGGDRNLVCSCEPLEAYADLAGVTALA